VADDKEGALVWELLIPALLTRVIRILREIRGLVDL
jgi:hypothetical protein